VHGNGELVSEVGEPAGTDAKDNDLVHLESSEDKVVLGVYGEEQSELQALLEA
jgi:hypothetical protein